MEAFFQKVTTHIRKRLWRYRLVVISAQVLPWFFVFTFVVTFLILIFSWNLKWIFFLGIPALSVVITTILRNRLNFPRPFETYQFKPLIEHKPGKSFPSRHTTSAVAIAMGCLYVNRAYGVFLLILASIVAITRVLCGLHRIRDVLVGAAIPVILGTVGYFMICPLIGLG